MDQQSPSIQHVLELLDVPDEGRVLDFAAGNGDYGVALAAARPDALVVVCEKDPDSMNALMTRAFEEHFENLVIGDTPAGPPADRGLAVNVFGKIEDLELVTLRTSMSPDGYVLFVDETATLDAMFERLKRLGYQRIERIDAPELPAHFVLRAR